MTDKLQLTGKETEEATLRFTNLIKSNPDYFLILTPNPNPLLEEFIYTKPMELKMDPQIRSPTIRPILNPTAADAYTKFVNGLLEEECIVKLPKEADEPINNPPTMVIDEILPYSVINWRYTLMMPILELK
jgi:hypothetical protein